MNFTLEKKHENRIEFSVKGTETYFANMVRRYSMSRVPVLAIDNVTFYDNTTALWDEYLAHRIGLFPVKTPKKLPKSAEVIFYLDFEGPGIAYSKDMKCEDKGVEIAKENIPIVTLGDKQKIKLEGKAVLGTAEQHAKFQSGLVSYGIEGDEIKFFTESFYHMEPSDVIIRGCDEMLSDIQDLKKQLKK